MYIHYTVNYVRPTTHFTFYFLRNGSHRKRRKAVLSPSGGNYYPLKRFWCLGQLQGRQLIQDLEDRQLTQEAFIRTAKHINIIDALYKKLIWYIFHSIITISLIELNVVSFICLFGFFSLWKFKFRVELS